MAPSPQSDAELLGQVRVEELTWHKQRALLYSSPLGRACYRLDRPRVEQCLADLRAHALLEAGLIFASEVRPAFEDRNLTALELKHFQEAIGCPPLILAALACGRELQKIRESATAEACTASAAEKEKEVQARAVGVVELLVQSGARVSAADAGPEGNTALHIVARSGAAQLLSALLRLNADLNARNTEGCCPELLAKQSGHIMCLQIMQAAAMIEMDRRQAELKELTENEQKPEPQRRTKDKKGKKLPKDRCGGGSAGADGKKSGLGEGPEQAGGNEGDAVRKSGVVGRDRDGTGGPRAPYGPHGFFSRLDEDQFPQSWLEDAELPDEWNESEWGAYEDWGEDWDDPYYEGDEEGDDDALTGVEDEDEVRTEVARLRKEKAESLERLYNFAVEREECVQATEQVERRAQRLEERAKRLEERAQHIEAGDTGAADDMAAEGEVSLWWEERATVHAKAVWELEKALAIQQKEQGEEIASLEKQLREMRRKTKGLEHYWDCFYDAQAANELLDRATAESYFSQLAGDLRRLVDSLELSPELHAQLPPLLIEAEGPGGGHEGGAPSVTLPPTRKLLIALQVHRAVQDARYEHEGHLEELVDFCNKQLAAKDEEIQQAIEEEICHRLVPEGEENVAEAWEHLSELVAHGSLMLNHLQQQLPAAQLRSSGGRGRAAGGRSQLRRGDASVGSSPPPWQEGGGNTEKSARASRSTK